MKTIVEAIAFPAGTPIDEISGRLKVFDRRPVQGRSGSTTVQDAKLEDVAGNSLKLSVWDHPDLKPMDGLDVVLAGRGGKGVTVKHDEYKDKNTGETVKKIVLSVNKSGSFSLTKAGAAPAPAQASPQSGPAVPAKGQIRGDKVGMAINNGVTAVLARAEASGDFPDNLMAEVGRVASDIIRLSNWLEQGNLYPASDEKPAAKPTPVAQPEPEDEIPF